MALLNCGVFPTTPRKAPVWAFDIKLLEFARQLSLYGSPNISALSNALGGFLRWRGMQSIPVSVSNLQIQESEAVTWFNVGFI